ncbi:MAG: MFS transporter, partial [Oscillospiraceae bacterium]
MKDQSERKNTLLFLSSQAISLFGSALVQYAITWYITLKTQSGLLLAGSIICGFLPTLFISPFSGALADRYDRKWLIALADTSIAVTTLIVAIIFYLGYDRFWMLFVALAIRAVGAGIQNPAVGAILPQFVAKENLARVNAVNGSIQSAIMLLAPMLGGAVFATTSITLIFLIDVITAILGVSILMRLNIPPMKRAKKAEKSGVLADMADGVRYIRDHKYLKSLFSFCAVYFMLVAPDAFLTPLQVART